MPTTIATPSNANTKVRFNEQYVSAGLNQKTVGAIPNGIIRGGLLKTAGAGLAVQIDLDPNTGDSVYTYTTPTGFQLTHRENGIRVLDLSTLTGQTVYIAFYALYSIGNPTIVEWRAYSEAELFGGAPVAEAASVVVVGKVVVPGVGPIPASNVSNDRARRAWKDVSAGMVPWKQVVQNGGFEEGPGACGTNIQSIPGYTGYLSGTAQVLVDTAPTSVPRSGDYALLMQMGGIADVGRIGPGAFVLADRFSSGPIPVKSGQLVDIGFWLSGDSVANYSQGTSGARLIVEFFDAAGVLISTSQVASDPAVHIGTFAYKRLDGIFEAPDDCYMRWYIEASANIGAGTSKFYFDDVVVFLQSSSAIEDVSSLIEPDVRTTILELAPRSATSVTGFNAKALRFIAEVLAGGETGLRMRQGDALNLVRWMESIISGAKDITDDSYGILGTPHYPQEDTTPTAFKLLHRYRIHSFGPTPFDARVYTSFTDLGLIFTVNARWNPGTSEWVKDDVTSSSGKFTIGRNFLRWQSKIGGGGPWPDASWDFAQSFNLSSAGDLQYTAKVQRTKWIPLSHLVAFNQLSTGFGPSVTALAAGGIAPTYILQVSGSFNLWVPLQEYIANGGDLVDFQMGFKFSGGSTLSPFTMALIQTLHDTVTIPLVADSAQSTVLAAASAGYSQPYEDHPRLTTLLNTGTLPQTLDHTQYDYNFQIAVGAGGGGAGFITYAKLVYNDVGPGMR